MQAAYFTEFELCGVDPPLLVRHYADWIAGTGEFARIRERRLELGVDAGWTSAALAAGGSFSGRDGARVEVALEPGSARVEFVHGDTRNLAIVWHSLARMLFGPAAIQIAHAVAREAPAGTRLDPVAATPVVLTSLLERDGVSVSPAELRATAPLTLNESGVPGFVERVLTSAERRVAIVIVAPSDRGAGELDVVRLARCLRGVAPVACLANEPAAAALERALQERGAAAGLGCSAGVRVYQPGLGAGDAASEHALFSPGRILRHAPRRRESGLAGEIIQLVAERRMPEDFF